MKDAEVVIVSHILDPHLAPIIYALEKINVRSVLWDWTRFPSQDVMSVSVDGAQDSFRLGSHPGDILPLGGLRSVWLRRMGRFTLNPNLSRFDLSFAKRESRYTVRGAIDCLSPSRWVNNLHAAEAAESKIRQLQVARECGFAIPSTLVSNDPLAVRDFFEKHDAQIVYKSFRPMCWTDSGFHEHVVETTRLSDEQVRNDDAIRATPGIFQKLVRKEYEVRVTVIGESTFALGLFSQSKKETVDWRMEQALGNVPAEAVDLPDCVREKCLLLCKKLGLDYGAIDLIVDQDGGYVFLEVNQSGNFLFLDDAAPELNVYQNFCGYLACLEKLDSRLPTFADYKASNAHTEWVRMAEELSPSADDPYVVVES